MTDTHTGATHPVPVGLGLTGAPNARDIGGYRTADGRRMVTGRVFRSDALSRLTAADTAVLSQLGVATVADLRGPGEVEALGADRLPGGVRLLPMPIFDPAADLYGLVARLLAAGPGRPLAALGHGGAERLMLDSYRWFVSDAGARQHCGGLLRRLAEPGALPLLYHCTAGKDRTGWLTAILLRLLGVEADTVLADYLASNEFGRPGLSRLVAEVGTVAPEVDPGLLTPLLQVRPDYLAAGLAAADARYGSFDSFVEVGLGVDAATRDALVAALLD